MKILGNQSRNLFCGIFFWYFFTFLFIAGKCDNHHHHHDDRIGKFNWHRFVDRKEHDKSLDIVLDVNDDGAVVQLPPHTILTIVVEGVEPYHRFVLMQAHTQELVVELSLEPDFTSTTHAVGTNIGVVGKIDYLMTSRFYLLNKWATPVNVLLLAKTGDRNDPIPGGCHSQADIVPYLAVDWNGPYFSTVFQQAGSNMSAWPSCEISSRSLQYTVYTFYLPEGDYGEEVYFDALSLMSDINRIAAVGDAVEIVERFTKNKSSFVGYPDVGVVVAVVVSDVTDNGRTYAYVPTVVYPCSRTSLQQCPKPMSPYEIGLCIFLLCTGLFLVLTGHRFFKCEMFLFGALAGSIMIYIVLGTGPTMDIYYTEFYLSLGVGALCAGITWFLLWVLIGSPVFSVVLPTLTAGFILSSVLYFLHPFYLPEVLSPLVEYSINLWLLFAIFTLLVAVLGVYFTHKLNIISCVATGSFLFVYGVGRLSMTSVPYVILNVLYRATVPEFETVNIIPPLQMREMILLVSWVMLILIGTCFQLWVEKGREQFPSPRCCNRDRTRYHTLEDQRWLLHRTRPTPPANSKVPPASSTSTQSPPPYTAEEREPLLTKPPPGYTYQAVA